MKKYLFIVSLVGLAAGQPEEQPEKKPMNLHQLFGTMTADQALKLKSGVIRHKQQKEIVRNVGSNRMKHYEKEVSEGKMTWSEALELSKNDLSPISRQLDSIFFDTDEQGKFMITQKGLLEWYHRNKEKPEFGEKESDRFFEYFKLLESRNTAKK